MAMTATAHIAAPHHNPLAALAGWLSSHLHRRPRPAAAVPVAEFVQALDVEALRLSLPLDDPDRHALENPAVEDAFAHLAIDHPYEVAVTSMRQTDREELLLAVCDEWFRHAHPAPEHRWSPQEIALYEQLLGSVHACFHAGGGAS